MSRRAHFGVLVMAAAVWAGFLLAGWPSYYQQYSQSFMIWFDSLVLLPIGVIVVIVLKRVHSARRLKIALWLSFHFTVPLAIYDWLYCGVYLGHGISFLVTFWYLSVYYLVPWFLLPGTALALNSISADQGRAGASQ